MIFEKYPPAKFLRKIVLIFQRDTLVCIIDWLSSHVDEQQIIMFFMVLNYPRIQAMVHKCSHVAKAIIEKKNNLKYFSEFEHFDMYVSQFFNSYMK